VQSGQLAAAVTAIKEKGVCLASGSSAKEVGRPGEFEALTDDELERALRERFSASGLTPDAGTRH
jgi:hypothetical protein